MTTRLDARRSGLDVAILFAAMLKLNRDFARIVIALALAVALTLVLGVDASKKNVLKGPRGGALVEDGSHKFEVVLDPEGKNVSVFTLKTETPPPQDMSVTLFRDASGTGQTIELRASDPTDPLPRYQGELASSGSYVGVELRFRTSLKALKVLRSIPRLPSRMPGGR